MFGDYGDINHDKLKIYYDAEFTGLHRNSTLISIGLVSESGHYFYAEFTDYDKWQLNSWIIENVIDKLVLGKTGNNEGYSIVNGNVVVKGTTSQIKEHLLEWLQNEYKDYGKQIQFYSDCYAYDWVLLNDLICEYGNALLLPKYIYYIPMDLSTVLQMKDIDPDINREEFVGDKFINTLKTTDPFDDMGDNCKHNSLWDAYVCKEAFMNLLTF